MCILQDNPHIYTDSHFFTIITKKAQKEIQVTKLLSWQQKKINKIKPPYLSGEDICRVSRGKAERVFAQTRNPKEELECLFNFCQINGKGTEIPQILRSRCEIGTGYSADLGHERGGKHISEIGAPGGLYARRPNARTEKNVQGWSQL